jgi:hypothetical protein
MAVLHGDHVRDVFHHEHYGLERFEHPREFEVQEVPGCFRSLGPIWPIPLARRAPEHKIDFSVDELPLGGGHAWMLNRRGSGTRLLETKVPSGNLIPWVRAANGGVPTSHDMESSRANSSAA